MAITRVATALGDAQRDSRVVKGKDVKFSVDDFEAAGTTAWEGVRNHEAKNLMKEMKEGDKVLFYHSNCKNPGIAGFAEVSKEAYPDYTAWDPTHPYYDQKTNKDEPRWYMVDLAFGRRAQYLVPLSLMKRIATLPTSEPPEDVGYIGEDGVKAIKGMALVNRGRLSVQRVAEETWSVIEMLAERGGWEEGGSSKSSKKLPTKTKKEPKRAARKRGTERETAQNDEEGDEDQFDDDSETEDGSDYEKPAMKKRKTKVLEKDGHERRSTRTRK